MFFRVRLWPTRQEAWPLEPRPPAFINSVCPASRRVNHCDARMFTSDSAASVNFSPAAFSSFGVTKRSFVVFGSTLDDQTRTFPLKVGFEQTAKVSQIAVNDRFKRPFYNAADAARAKRSPAILVRVSSGRNFQTRPLALRDANCLPYRHQESRDGCSISWSLPGDSRASQRPASPLARRSVERRYCWTTNLHGKAAEKLPLCPSRCGNP